MSPIRGKQAPDKGAKVLDLGANTAKERRLALLFISLSVLLWGVSFISTKIVLAEIPPVSIAFFRQIIAVSALVPIALIGGHLSKVTLRDFTIMAAAGFFGTVAYFILENTGLQYTTASNASMIVSALPAMTLFAEAVIFKARVTGKMVACLLLSALGVYLLVTLGGRMDLSSTRFYGNLLILGAMISWVAYNIVNRGITGRYSSVTLTTYQAIASAFLFVPFVLGEAGSWRPISEISIPVLANLVFLGLFCSALAYFFYLYALGRLGATVSSSFLNLIPVVTAVFGYLVLYERLTWIQIFGMVLIMFSIFSLNRLTSAPP